MSQTLDALREAARVRDARREEELATAAPRPYRVLAVVSNKGGVGKTTTAANLAVYVRALREDLPILVVGLDDQDALDRMFALGAPPPDRRRDVADGLRAGHLDGVVRLGQYGVHYVPATRRIPELKREIDSDRHLDAVLRRTGWRGLVILDTKSDLEILTRNALAASDLALVLVKDRTSLDEADRVFALLDEWGRGNERARVLLSQLDLRVKYGTGPDRDVLALLLRELRQRGRPHFATFVSRSPAVESLATNPEGRLLSVLHGAPASRVHRQMHGLALEVLEALDAAAPAPAPERARAAAPVLATTGPRAPRAAAASDPKAAPAPPAAAPPAARWGGGPRRAFHRWLLRELSPR